MYVSRFNYFLIICGLFAVSAWSTSSLPAFSQEDAAQLPVPPDRPFLRLDTEVHREAILKIGFDQKCEKLISGSIDKTVKIWDISQGSVDSGRGLNVPWRTLRVPIADKEEGMVYGVALSPNAKFAAAGGWDVYAGERHQVGLYIFDVVSEKLLKRLDPAGGVVIDVAFSPDGDRLAVVFGSGVGLRVWDTANWELVAEDTEYSGEESFGVAFDKNGRIFTISKDKWLRLYSQDFSGQSQIAPSQKMVLDEVPIGLAVHPDGDRIALVYRNSTRVDIYNAMTLERLEPMDIGPTVNKSFQSVAWSADGETLYASGFQDGQKEAIIRSWERSGYGANKDKRDGKRSVQHMKQCGDLIATATTEPAIVIYNSELSELARTPNVLTQTVSNPAWRDIRISDDATVVRFSPSQDESRALVFDTKVSSLTEEGRSPNKLNAPDQKSVVVTDWRDSDKPKYGPKEDFFNLVKYEKAMSFAAHASSGRFALGTSFYLRRYDATGELKPEQATDAPVVGLNYSKDGRTIVAAYGDGTIRWHNASDGAPLLALFVYGADKRWVLWTPSGYYDASKGSGDSPGGDTLIKWHINAGWNEAPKVYSAGQFRQQFLCPYVVNNVLKTLEENSHVEEARNAKRCELIKTDIQSDLPPEVEITYPDDEWPIGSVTPKDISFKIKSPNGRAIKRISIQYDGSTYRILTESEIPALSKDNIIDHRVRIDNYPAKDFKLSIIADTDTQSSKAAIQEWRWIGKDVQAPLPKLYAIMIGVGTYKHGNNKSSFKNLGEAPLNDVDKISLALKSQEKMAFSKVETLIFKDNRTTESGTVMPATKDNIEKQGFLWLAERLQGPDDIGLVYFSGHGKTVDGGPHLLPFDYDPRISDKTATTLDVDHLAKRLISMNGTKILVIDACHAGDNKIDVDQHRRIKNPNLAEVITILSSEGSEESYIDNSNKVSIFSDALRRALEDRTGDFRISESGNEVPVGRKLQDWLRWRINLSLEKLYPDEKARKAHTQTPHVDLPSSAPSVTLARFPRPAMTQVSQARGGWQATGSQETRRPGHSQRAVSQRAVSQRAVSQPTVSQRTVSQPAVRQ